MKRKLTLLLSSLALATCVAPSSLVAGTVDGFTEPYRRVAVPAPEVGILSAVNVEEGDRVRSGDVLAKLDDEVLKASLAVARAAKEAKGGLAAAEAENEARKKILEGYKRLSEKGNASQREYERAVNEQLKASANLQSVREELEVRRLEYERVKAQIEQRQIKSPINGHVVAVDKEAGEFVSPTDPVILHIAQLDKLKAVFSVPRKAVQDVKVGQEVVLSVGFEETRRSGRVEFVSPTADPQSGSVRVKVAIANEDGKIQSGSSCRWELDSYEGNDQITSLPVLPKEPVSIR